MGVQNEIPSGDIPASHRAGRGLAADGGLPVKQPKQLLFSVTAKDFEMQTFSVGGHGGSGKDTSNSGVRLIHPPSGARGEGREHRSLTLNRRAAFERLVASKEFKNWHRIECARRRGQPVPETPIEIMGRVDRMIEQGLRDGSIKIEEFEPVQPGPEKG